MTAMTLLRRLALAAVPGARALRLAPLSRADVPARAGRIVLVGAGPGAVDLLTLRGLRHLREADVIFHDRLVEPELLELARPGTERVYVGKEVGAHAWPQPRINAAILAEARRGRRVVRLKSGDPGIFGRAGEELAAAREAGIETEIVPGVTSACAAAAAMGTSLTERGVSDMLILATGTGVTGLPECLRAAGPGTTTAFYMAARQAGRIARGLMDRGMPAGAGILVGIEVSKPGERLLRCRLDELPATLAMHGITGSAMILATWPKPERQAARHSVRLEIASQG